VSWSGSDSTPQCLTPNKPGTGAGYDLEPGIPLSCTVQLPQWIFPGVYRIHAEALGHDIKSQEAQADVRVRAPWHFAFVSLLIGSLVGAWIVSWSRDGRERLLTAIQAQETREQYVAVEMNVSSAGPYTQQLITERKQQLARIVESLRIGASVSTYTATLDHLRDLLPLIGRLYNLEQQFDHPTGSKKFYDDAVAALHQDDPDLSTCRTRLEMLETDLRNIVASQRQAFPDTGSPLFFFSWAPGLTAMTLRGLLRRNDLILSWISILVAVLIGMATLWSSNPTWGSLTDWLVGFLTGVGITVGGTVSLQQIAQNYQLGSLARR
jgi:hypothetical protein